MAWFDGFGGPGVKRNPPLTHLATQLFVPLRLDFVVGGGGFHGLIEWLHGIIDPCYIFCFSNSEMIRPVTPTLGHGLRVGVSDRGATGESSITAPTPSGHVCRRPSHITWFSWSTDVSTK